MFVSHVPSLTSHTLCTLPNIVRDITHPTTIETNSICHISHYLFQTIIFHLAIAHPHSIHISLFTIISWCVSQLIHYTIGGLIFLEKILNFLVATCSLLNDTSFWILSLSAPINPSSWQFGSYSRITSLSWIHCVWET